MNNKNLKIYIQNDKYLPQIISKYTREYYVLVLPTKLTHNIFHIHSYPSYVSKFLWSVSQTDVWSKHEV